MIEKQIAKLQATVKPTETVIARSEATKQSPTTEGLLHSARNDDFISYDDFSKMDLRIGTIIEAEKVPKTDKLLKLTIDTGIDKRTVVSGIAHNYEPEQIIGQQVTLLMNLQPRKIKGIESHGMILMAEDGEGKLKFVMPSEKINSGSKVS